jgi:hypothetical protein
MQLLDLVNAAGGINAIASQVGLSEGQARAGVEALLPAVLGGFKQQVSGGGGLAGLTSLLQGAGGASLLENVVGPSATNVQAGNDLLGQLFGSKDVSRSVADQAAQRSGLSADTLKKMLPLLAMVVSGVLASKSGQGGAAGALGGLLSGASAGGLASLLDLDGDGNPLDDIAGLAGKLFGR